MGTGTSAQNSGTSRSDWYQWKCSGYFIYVYYTPSAIDTEVVLCAKKNLPFVVFGIYLMIFSLQYVVRRWRGSFHFPRGLLRVWSKDTGGSLGTCDNTVGWCGAYLNYNLCQNVKQYWRRNVYLNYNENVRRRNNILKVCVYVYELLPLREASPVLIIQNSYVYVLYRKEMQLPQEMRSSWKKAGSGWLFGTLIWTELLMKKVIISRYLLWMQFVLGN